MMDSMVFGKLALQLLAAAHIPGGEIDAALAFRDMARDLAEGRARVTRDEEAGADVGA